MPALLLHRVRLGAHGRLMLAAEVLLFTLGFLSMCTHGPEENACNWWLQSDGFIHAYDHKGGGTAVSPARRPRMRSAASGAHSYLRHSHIELHKQQRAGADAALETCAP